MSSSTRFIILLPLRTLTLSWILVLCRSVSSVAQPQVPKGSFCSAPGWKQVWADEFDEPALDTSSWTLDLGGKDSLVRDALGTADNVYVQNGVLVLRSQRENKGSYQYTSGAVKSQGKRSWKGLTRACVRAKLPGRNGGGDGIWPAHWMMPDNKACWPANGEIDIMEMVNGDGTLHGTYHWRERELGGCGDTCKNGSTGLFCKHDSRSASTPVGSSTDAYNEDFHEYAVEYGPDHIHFALDGVVYTTLDRSTSSTIHPARRAEFFDVPYYMMLNTAIGGPWPKPPNEKTMFPTYHYIDYVRVSQASTEASTLEQITII